MNGSWIDVVIVAGAIAWWTTALVHKDGPYKVFHKFRHWVKKHIDSPFGCTHCASAWVGVVVVALWAFEAREPVYFFGILGIAQALRGASQEYS